MFSNPIMEGAKNKSRKKSDNKREHSQTNPPTPTSSTSKPPTSNATKLIMFARKLSFYNYLPSFIRASFEKFIKFIIFF
jgi:hypothetical protein